MISKKKLLVIVLGLAALILAYRLWGGGVADNDAIKENGHSVIFGLRPQNNSRQSGEVKIEELNGQAYVTIDIAKGPTGVNQPVNIYFASCAKPGQIKYPLAPVVDGHSETLLGGTLAQLKKELPLAIVVQKSDGQSDTYVACGDIKI